MRSAESSHWLYERWRATAQQFSNELALVEFPSGKRWTFSQLRAEGEGGPSSIESIVFPSGQSATFIVEILRAWRGGKTVCPLEAGHAIPEVRPVPSRIAHLKLTSASTGPAKCIAFTAAQLAADPANIVATMGLRPEWPNIACISLSHSYGFSNFVLPLLLHGIPLVILAAPLPEMFLRAAREFEGVTVAAVPALWRSWHESKSIPRNVRLAISAGAPLRVELEQTVFAQDEVKIHNFYGSSECGGIAYDRSTTPRKDNLFAGTAMENVHLSVSPRGTLVVESAAVGETYWPEGHESLNAPFFQTTDLAQIRTEGIYLEGRATDVINVAGRKVSPEAIELALREHAAVAECVVFGVAQSENDRFETVVACINPREEVEIGELTRFLSQRLPNWQIPREWWFTAQLEPNPRGKVSRAEWRQRFLQMRASARSERP